MRHLHPHYLKRKSAVQEAKYIHWLDRFMLVIAVVGPLSDIPQIHRIYTTQNAAGVSLLTFIFYTAVSVLWLIYGLAHRQKPIILSSIAWVATETAIITGILLYS